MEWILLACLAQLGKPDGTSAYLRLSTRPVDQGLAAVPADPAAREARRRQAVAGAYRLRRTEHPRVTIAVMGALTPEALAAAGRLDAAGVPADVICVTSPGLLFQALLARQGRADAPSWILDQVFPASRATPLVTVLDGHPHTLAFLATINQVPIATLGVTRFGQSGLPPGRLPLPRHRHRQHRPRQPRPRQPVTGSAAAVQPAAAPHAGQHAARGDFRHGYTGLCI